jgi:hypothetical protein
MSKTIHCTAKGILIHHENHHKSHFVPYAEELDQKYYQDKAARKSIVAEMEMLHLNPVQSTMYERLVRGLGYFSKSDIANMPQKTKSKIEAEHSKAQFLVRKLRVDAYFKAETKLLNAIFPHANIGSKVSDYYNGADVPRHVTNQRLGITKKVMIETFIQNRLLPVNFFDITVESTALSLNA